jgi:hypothetical protein
MLRLFVPDPDAPLFTEVVEANARFFNECGFDSIYQDALDGEDTLGGRENSWHYGTKFVWELWKRLERPAAMEYSTFATTCGSCAPGTARGTTPTGLTNNSSTST